MKEEGRIWKICGKNNEDMKNMFEDIDKNNVKANLKKALKFEDKGIAWLREIIGKRRKKIEV